MDDEAVVDFKGLRQEFGITYGRTHLQRLEHAEKFPKRLRPSGDHRSAHVFWRRREIPAWLNIRIDCIDPSRGV